MAVGHLGSEISFWCWIVLGGVGVWRCSIPMCYIYQEEIIQELLGFNKDQINGGDKIPNSSRSQSSIARSKYLL